MPANGCANTPPSPGAKAAHDRFQTAYPADGITLSSPRSARSENFAQNVQLLLMEQETGVILRSLPDPMNSGSIVVVSV